MEFQLDLTVPGPFSADQSAFLVMQPQQSDNMTRAEAAGLGFASETC